jgi:uncharacterized protein YicC (UPF0701 family)
MDTIIKDLPGVMAVIISIIGVYLQYRKAGLDNKKGEVDMAKVLQDNALALIKPYREELDRLQSDVAKASKKIEDLECEVIGLRNKLDLVIQERNAIWNGAKVLHFQVKSVGVEPVYTPPESVVELVGIFKGKNEGSAGLE